MKNLKEKIRNIKGITLIALVITIIVLLILAGVSLSMIFSQDGIFSRAEQATDKYGQAKARETLELALGEAQMKKYEEGLTDEQLDNKINEIGELLPKEDLNSNNQQVIVDGHIFEIDRSVPKIVDYIGPADGVVITATITQNGDWKNPIATVKGMIKTYSGGNITNSTATVASGNANVENFPTDGGNYTIENITEDTDIRITAVDSKEKKNEKLVRVRLIIDDTPPTITSLNVKNEGLNITIDATAEDSESGLKDFTYTIVPSTGLSQTEGRFTQGHPATITSTVEERYTVTIVAEDNSGNKSEPQSQIVENWGAIKHIKLKDGTLKEVNSRNVYGADVIGYTCTRKKDDGSELNWQIFYIDDVKNDLGKVIESQVYLISKDYMAPPNLNTDLIKYNGSNSKGYYFGSEAYDEYVGKIPNTSFTAKFLSEYKDVSTTKRNLKATNYMLDQDKWEEYCNKTKADYAFGGPTLPLFQASYNDICKTATKLKIRTGENGYQLSKDMESWSSNISGLGDTTTQNEIYFHKDITSSTKGMWLSSPAHYHPNNQNTLFYSADRGELEDCSCDSALYDYGFRPIVSLKTNVKFTDNGDGTYTITMD